MLYGKPLLHAGIGFLGGYLGSRIWRPLRALTLAGPGAAASPLETSWQGPSLFAGRIAWFRVLVGTVIAVCGTIWANVILNWVLDAAEGKLEITTQVQLQLVTWEITALSMLLGSALAGATRANSLKQGLGVGLASSFLLIGLRTSARPEQAQVMLLIVASSVALGLAGSWFGGQLFPPVYPAPRRKRWSSAGL
jgi:hypothetical protein